MTKRVCLGKIKGAHGVRGLVKCAFFGEDPSLLETETLYTGEETQDTIEITLKSPQKGGFICEVDGIDDRDIAQKLNGTGLYVDRDVLPDTDDDDFYYDDLVGLDVRDSESNDVIGKVKAVENFGAGDLLEINPTTGSSFYIPFTKASIPEVNLEEGYVLFTQVEELSCEQ